MTEVGKAPPPIDLAPRFHGPLSLWNPLDYLRLLYWAFWFPQAIRGYVEQFGKPKYQHLRGGGLAALREDLVQRRLAVQGLFLSTLVPFGVGWGLKSAGVPLSWTDIVFVVAGGAVGGVATGFAFLIEGRVATGVAAGVAGSFAGDVAGGVAGSVASGVAFVVAGGVAVLVGIGFAFLVASVVAGGVAVSVTDRNNGAIGSVFLAFFFAGGLAVFFAFFVTLASDGILAGVLSGVVAGGVALLYILRTLGWLRSQFSYFPISRVTFLPLLRVRKELDRQFAHNWERGVASANQYLMWTLQFVPVVRAVEASLSKSPATELVHRIATLANRPFDWNLIRYASSNIGNTLRSEAFGLILLPPSWQKTAQARFHTEVRLDTPARAACAGFWLWHEKEASKATAAFERIASLPHGAELHMIALAIQAAEAVNDTATLASWAEVVTSAFDKPLRPNTLNCLADMAAASRELTTALSSRNRSVRQAALGRAIGKLQGLLDVGLASCPEPEEGLLRPVTSRWLEIVSRLAGEAGEAALKEKVANPFVGYSGRPVRGQAFVGRVGVMERLKRLLATPSPPAIFLYGQRRMGKSSILLNLESLLGAETVLVYLDLQSIGWSDRPNELLFEVARALHQRLEEAGIHAGAPPDRPSFADLGDARRPLRIGSATSPPWPQAAASPWPSTNSRSSNARSPKVASTPASSNSSAPATSAIPGSP